MLKLLNNPKSDNTRNILNADLFVSNLHNTLKVLIQKLLMKFIGVLLFIILLGMMIRFMMIF